MLNSLKQLFGLLDRRERRNFFIVLFVMVVLVFLEMARVGSVLPLIATVADPNVIEENRFFRQAHEFMGSPGYQPFFIVMAVGLILVTLMRNGWHALTDYSIIRYSKLRAYTISSRLLERYLSQPYAYFLNHNTAALSRNVLGEVRQATNFLTNAMKFLSQALKAVGLVALIIFADPVLAAIAAGTLLILYGGTYAVIRGRLAKYGKRRLVMNRERFKSSAEVLNGIKTVRTHDSETYFLNRFSRAAYRTAKLQALIDLLSTVPKYVLDSIVYGGIIAVVIFFVVYVGSIEDQLGTLGLFVVAATRLMPALKQSLNHYSKMRGEFPSVHVIYEDMQRSRNVDLARKAAATAPDGSDRIFLTREIAFDGVSFRYEGAEAPLFDKLDLRIPANTTVGLVGTTGCGKTTSLDILLGLLSPETGHVRVDDTVITDENVPAWRRNIGYVPQDIYLIDDTVSRNIAFGLPDEEINQEQVKKAARVAQVADFIEDELPDGFETLVGERGVRLSGGQRQRLGIARALYREPEVLVFDEATSALDSRTEREVLTFIDSLAHRKTIIMIAHRLSTVQRCDNIYVMDKGHVVDEGTYDELMERNEHFRALAQVST